MSPHPIPPDPPDPSRKSGIDLVDDLGLENGTLSDNNQDGNTVDDHGPAHNGKGRIVKSTLATLQPFESSPLVSETGNVLYVHNLSLDMSYALIYNKFISFGPINDIRVKLTDLFQSWEVWVSFTSSSDAAAAQAECLANSVTCELVAKAPFVPDVYYPPASADQPENVLSRSPRPAKWLIVSSTEERANLVSFRRFLKRELGPNNITPTQVTRFGRSSFLVHVNTDVQAAMISNLKRNSDGKIKEVKPHFDFSYAKGVIFHRDLHEFSQEEILEMCPPNVWKVFKVPRSSMIILTFTTEKLLPHVVIENERIYTKPYRPKPLQCFSCYGFGHSSKRCTREKICCLCAHPVHGDCDRESVCVNCRGNHNARSKECGVFKKEQAAVLKAHDERISVGHAKYLLAKHISYSDKVKNIKPVVPSESKRLPSGDASTAPKPQRSPRRTRLPPEELEIHPDPQPSFEEASQPPRLVGSGGFNTGIPHPHSGGVPQASLEASQACSLPDLGDSPMETMLSRVPLVVETHKSNKEKSERGRVKRNRTPSPSSPPRTSHTRTPYLSKRSSSLDRLKAPKDKKKKEKDKSSSGKPFLNRPLETRLEGHKK